MVQKHESKIPSEKISLNVRRRIMLHIRPTKIQISLRIRAVSSEFSLDTF